ncbi:MAG: helix-turn-helix domain-containing protein [Verrucomicrobiae bacterium]|nr:helix-turn-helix domain-containing protein [Verrucomicrobiae bacterium]
MLNVSKIKESMVKHGLNQSQLAERMKVSREAVSKWISGESEPRPDKLLRLGMLLDLTFQDLMVRDRPYPKVNYRKKGNRITRENHMRQATEKADRLERLVEYLPFEQLTQPPYLREPELDYDYIQRVAEMMRGEMGIAKNTAVDFRVLIEKFNELQAVIIPVLWGEKEQHGNALHIYLPTSKTTWIYLNLDSRLIDFKFWMSHELGHTLASTLEGDEAEDFADAFAQALLYPKEEAERLYNRLSKQRTIALRIKTVLSESEKYVISPYTIYKAVGAFAAWSHQRTIDFGKNYMGAFKNYEKRCPTVIEDIRKNTDKPDAAEYISIVADIFQSPFIESLQEYSQGTEGLDNFIHTILDISLADAKTMAEAIK